MSNNITFPVAKQTLESEARRFRAERPGTTWDAALMRATEAYPSLYKVVENRDRNGNLLPGATPPAPAASAPAGPHESLVAMAETIRKSEPTLSPALAYLRATEQRPDLLDDAIRERPPVQVDDFAERQRRLMTSFSESPAGKAHAQLQAFGEQIRQRPGFYNLTQAAAYAEAVKLHPDLFAQATGFMEGQNNPRPVTVGGSSAGQLASQPDRQAAGRDGLSPAHGAPLKPSMPKGGEDPLTEEYMKVARRAQRPGESIEDAFRRVRKQAGVKE
jgi:hypothetical protein